MRRIATSSKWVKLPALVQSPTLPLLAEGVAGGREQHISVQGHLEAVSLGPQPEGLPLALLDLGVDACELLAMRSTTL